MLIYLQPPYLQGQLPNNRRLLCPPISGAKPSTESRVEDLITAIARRVYSDGTRKPVQFAVEKFLRLTERQSRHLSEDGLKRKIDFLKLLASEDFLSREGYEYSDQTIIYKLGQEFTAFNDKYERSRYRILIQEFVKGAKENAPTDTIVPDSFKRREVIASVLAKSELSHIIYDLRDLIKSKTPGVFKLLDRLGEAYNNDNSIGLSFELKVAKTLQREGFKIIELSHDYSLENEIKLSRKTNSEVDIVAEKDGQRFYVEAKNNDTAASTEQLVTLIKYARTAQKTTPVLVVNKEGHNIHKFDVGQRLWRVEEEVGLNNLRIWDKNLIDVTDNFQPIEPLPPVDKPVQPKENL
jgi:Holliday junction resolvase